MVQVAASSTLVNVAEDAELRLIRLLAESAPPSSLRPTFLRDCESCIVNADASQLIKTVVDDPGAIGALFVLEPADEAISAFSLLTALLDRVGGSQEQVQQLTNQLADAVIQAKLPAKDANAVVERQIALLSVLYNMRPDVKDKCALLTKMIHLAKGNARILDSEQPIGRLLYEDAASAGASSANTMISPPAPVLVTMLDEWEIQSEERRDLYNAIAQGVTDQSRKQRFLLLLLDSYQDAKQIDNQGLNAAREAALGAIRDPVSLFVHQRNMLSLPAIQALARNKATASLFGLLKVFQEGKLDDYNKFIKENGGEDKLLSKQLGLDPAACVRYMRILSLCSLAAEHEEIPYAVIQETLALESEKDVESWVIAAVSSGLLVAKMDQLQHKVMVERSIVRRFDIEQWKILQARLTQWKKNVGNVIRGLKQSQQLAAGTTAAAADK